MTTKTAEGIRSLYSRLDELVEQLSEANGRIAELEAERDDLTKKLGETTFMAAKAMSRLAKTERYNARISADLDAMMESQIETARLCALMKEERDEAYRAFYRVSGYDRAEHNGVAETWEKARAFVEGEVALGEAALRNEYLNRPETKALVNGACCDTCRRTPDVCSFRGITSACAGLNLGYAPIAPTPKYDAQNKCVTNISEFLEGEREDEPCAPRR